MDGVSCENERRVSSASLVGEGVREGVIGSAFEGVGCGIGKIILGLEAEPG